VEITLYEGLGHLPLFTPDLTEALPTAAAELRARLAQADGLLIASPEYAHGVPGGIKNALDWIVGWGEVAERPVALFDTSEYGEHAKAALAEILKTMSLHIVLEAALTIHLRGKQPDEARRVLALPANVSALRHALEAFVRVIRVNRGAAPI
jgi:chromate reductase, NAD(P)H dehydrogenase (quinone)